MKDGFVFRYYHSHAPAKVRLSVDSESDAEKLVDAFAAKKLSRNSWWAQLFCLSHLSKCFYKDLEGS